MNNRSHNLSGQWAVISLSWHHAFHAHNQDYKKPHTAKSLQFNKSVLVKPFHLLSHTRKTTYKSESVYTNHCIMFPLHLVFNLLLNILHDLLWLIIFPIRNHKIKDHIRMCWPFDHSKVMN